MRIYYQRSLKFKKYYWGFISPFKLIFISHSVVNPFISKCISFYSQVHHPLFSVINTHGKNIWMMPLSDSLKPPTIPTFWPFFLGTWVSHPFPAKNSHNMKTKAIKLGPIPFLALHTMQNAKKYINAWRKLLERVRKWKSEQKFPPFVVFVGLIFQIWQISRALHSTSLHFTLLLRHLINKNTFYCEKLWHCCCLNVGHSIFRWLLLMSKVLLLCRQL